MAAIDLPLPTLAPSTLAGLADEILGELVAAGSDDAFAVLDARYRRRLARYARGIVTAEDAEDAAQDALLRALRALRGGRSRPDAISPWLHRIARNCALDLAASRRRAPLVELVDGDAPQPPGEDAHAAVERRQRVTQVMSDVGGLSDSQHSALVLRELEGRSYVDIADRLDVTVPAVKSLLVRARAGLRRAGEGRAAAWLPFPMLGRLLERAGTIWEPVTAAAAPKVACVAVVAAGSVPAIGPATETPPPAAASATVAAPIVKGGAPAKHGAPAVGAGAAAPAASLAEDCADGTVDGTFSVAQISAALQRLSADGREYDSGCVAALQDARFKARRAG